MPIKAINNFSITYFKGKQKQNKPIITYYDASNHQKESEKLADGTERKWDYYTGHLYFEKLPDGSEKEWYKGSKNLAYEKLADGTERRYYNGGGIEMERLANGITRRWNSDGELIYEGVEN